jgi:SPP1 family predicted phage head-tail adaptor
LAKCCSDIVGQLKRRVTIQSSSTFSDGQGGFTESWVDGATVYASVEPIKGFERMQAMQMQEPITHKIMMRFRGDVTSASRLKFGDRVFWVKEALNVNEDGRLLEIRAIERAIHESEADIGALLLNTGGYLLLGTGGRILLGA